MVNDLLDMRHNIRIKFETFARDTTEDRKPSFTIEIQRNTKASLKSKYHKRIATSIANIVLIRHEHSSFYRLILWG